MPEISGVMSIPRASSRSASECKIRWEALSKAVQKVYKGYSLRSCHPQEIEFDSMVHASYDQVDDHQQNFLILINSICMYTACLMRASSFSQGY